MTRQFSGVLLMLVLCASVYAFDIAVYFDARSGVNWRCQNPFQYFCWDSTETPRSTVLANIGSDNEQQVYEWFREMGVNYVINYYPFSDDFTNLLSMDPGGMKVLNWSWPAEAFKYLESQNRDIFVGELDDDYVNDDESSWGGEAVSWLNDTLGIPALQYQSGTADTMWQPQSALGIWNGWNWREAGISGDIYMPMHFQIICNLDTFGTPEGDERVASFYWLVRNYDSNGQEDGWWRYPEQVLTVDSFTTPENQLDTIRIRINPHPDSSGIFNLLDENFDLSPTDEAATGHAYGAGPLDEYTGYHAFGALWGVPVRMCVYYEGHDHTFQIYNVSIWDEGYHRLFVSGDSLNYYDTLRTAFQQQFNSVGDSLMGGWYYDEWQQNEMLKSLVKVNKIIQGYVPSTMWMNGHFRWPNCEWCPGNLLFEEMQRQGVSFPVHMDEFYFLGGKTICHSNLQFTYTLPASDTTYFHFANCGTLEVEAERSLQCAIDQRVWGDSAVIAAYNVPIDSNYQHVHLSLLDQVNYVHQNSTAKFWAMIQGDDDDYVDNTNDSLNESYCCTLRPPTANEVKLSAWLAVACNADGVLYYPVSFGGGLLEWDPPLADNCPDGALMDGPVGVDTTDRYWAAREAGQDIQRLAPYLDSLRFVSTYASRAYEVDYPDSVYEATQRDILATNTSWFGTPYRSVEGILAFEQDGAGWEETPETHPYVQVSRFRAPNVPLYNPEIEDYWFLVVNRRALADERRKVQVVMEIDSSYMNYPYYARYILEDTTKLTGPSCTSRIPECALRRIDVILEPGEAELIHFWRSEFGCADTLPFTAEVTAIPSGPGIITLRWNETRIVDDLPYITDTYFIYGSPYSDGPFYPIGLSTDTTYVDSVHTAEPHYFYEVQSCGEYE